MPCSEAQAESNRRNAEKSTGPRTAEGKAASRRNAWKHGLTGAGVVLPHEDTDEVARRLEALETDMGPKNELARRFVAKVAHAFNRLDRCAEHETKAIAYAMRKAEAAFDDERKAESEKALSWIAAEPATNARRLRSTPEGIDLLIGRLEGLRSDLAGPYDVTWSFHHCEQFHHYQGLRRSDVPHTRARALGLAVTGHFQELKPDDLPDLPTDERRIWAADRLIELVNIELDQLKALKETINLDAIALDRSEAPMRALFNPGKDAILARKYEAAINRDLYRSLDEFRQAQAIPPEVAAQMALEAGPLVELGSFLPEPPPVPDDQPQPAETQESDQFDEQPDLDPTPKADRPGKNPANEALPINDHPSEGSGSLNPAGRSARMVDRR
jgi:hypothetical protein